MRSRSNLVLLSTLLLITSATPVLAQDPNNGAQVVVQGNSQTNQQVIPDGTGGAIVVWTDGRNNQNNDIYAQRLDGSGNALWSASGVAVCIAPGEQANIRAISDGLGGIIVAWQDGRAGGAQSNDIYAQRLNAAGQTQWAYNGVALCQSTNSQELPDLVSDGSGGAIVTWQDIRTNEWDIYAQRVGSGGSTQWTVNGVNLTLNASYQQFPRIVRDASGGCIIAWQDSRLGSWDLYAQRLNASGVSQWQFNGIEVSMASGEQRDHRMVEDGSGGVLLAWEDLRNGPVHIYGQRLNAGGVALWTVNGVAVLTSGAGAVDPRVASDGAGGMIVTWQDTRTGGSTPNDIYAQRVPATGIPGWTGNGVAVCAVAGDQTAPEIATVQGGTVVIAWQDARVTSNNLDVYVQRLDLSGALLWTSEGELACSAPGHQFYPAVVTDGAGGAIAVWQDYRYPTQVDLFAQRFAASREMLFPDAEHPRLISVRDTPNDQGGRVKLSWRGSNRDLAPIADVTEYRIWRSVPPSYAVAKLAQTEAVRDPEPGTIVAMNSPTGFDYWEFLATQPAGRLPGYSYVAATTSDSIPNSNPKTGFMIEARTLNGVAWWYSNVDSGYSVDNLPPFVVMSLAGTFSPGAGLSMHWHANLDADLANYVIHRGATADFVPGPGNHIGTTADTAFVDPAGSFNYYKVAAVDVHGNRGPFATLASQDVPVGTLLGRFLAEEEGATIRITVGLSEQAQGLTVRILRATEPDLGLAKEIVVSSSSIEGGMHSYVDAGVEAGQSYWYWVELRDADGIVAVSGPVVATTSSAEITFVRPAYPNPTRSSTVFSFAIGRDVAPAGSARVSLRIYDARGRVVSTLLDEVKTTGAHETIWDGADTRGARLANGIYYWQLQAGAVVKRGSVVLMR